MSEAPSAWPGRFRIGMRWILGFCILAAASAAAWLLAVNYDRPWIASGMVIAAVGGVFYRLARISTLGIVLWCLAALALATARWTPFPNEMNNLHTACALLGIVLFLASTVVFLAVALRDRTHRGGNCACCNLALFTLIAWGAGYMNVDSHLRQEQSVRRTTETLLTFHKLAAEIDSIRMSLGRLPKNEEELVALRRAPMPTFYMEYRIKYQRFGGSQYRLDCCLSDFWGRGWDFFGWIVFYEGPNSRRPIQVIPF